VTVSMDDQPLTSQLDGAAIPLDPGLHSFCFTAAGQPTLVQSFVIGEGQKDRREVITFGAATAMTPSPAAVTAEPTLRGDATSERRRDQQIAGIATGGVGVVSLVLGAVFGGLAASDWSSAQGECKTVACTRDSSTSGYKDEHSAASEATASTASFIAGGVLVAAGALLFFTARPSPARTGVRVVPTGGRDSAGVILGGSF
jgi:hypothetical protein